MDFNRLHLVARTPPHPQDAMTIDTEDLTPFFTYNSPAKGRYHSEYIGTVDFHILPEDGNVAFSLKVYVNAPLPPPAGCARCAHTLSLIPELSIDTGRVN